MADIVPINAFKKDNNVELLSVRCLGVNDSRGHYFFLFSVIIKITLLPLAYPNLLGKKGYVVVVVVVVSHYYL